MEKKAILSYIKNYITTFFMLICSHIICFSQTDSLPSVSKTIDEVSVFVDCEFCDIDYLKQEIPYVNYSRDQNEANIYLIITEQITGSGGKEFTILFSGQKNFEFMNDIFKYVSKPSNTEEEIRIGITQTVKLGLMRYVAKTTFADKVSIDFKKELSNEEKSIKDNWRNWVFTTNLGGSFYTEQSFKSLSANFESSINKVTEKQKLQFIMNYYYRENVFSIVSEKITSIKNSKSIRNIYVKSMGKHWSAGYISQASSSTYQNIKAKFSLHPALEYDLFPYSESTSKQLRFLYSAGLNYYQYFDTTIFLKTEETHLNQNLEVSLSVIKKWGSVSTALSWTNLFADFSKNNFNIWTELSVRVFKGFSINLSGNVSLIHDQFYLPKTDATGEEILLQQRQLATAFYYYGRVGISYTFGSMYNNIVNPRFGN